MIVRVVAEGYRQHRVYVGRLMSFRILLIVALLSLFGRLHADALYSSYIDNGQLKMVIQEQQRGADYSLLLVVAKGDQQPVPFAVLTAAIAIGEQLGHRYFALLGSEEKDEGSLIRLFFTSDPDTDPASRFGDALSEDDLRRFHAQGYMPIAELKTLMGL